MKLRAVALSGACLVSAGGSLATQVPHHSVQAWAEQLRAGDARQRIDAAYDRFVNLGRKGHIQAR